MGSSAGSYLADPTSPIPSHCASIVVTSTLGVNQEYLVQVCSVIQLSKYTSQPALIAHGNNTIQKTVLYNRARMKYGGGQSYVRELHHNYAANDSVY